MLFHSLQFFVFFLVFYLVYIVLPLRAQNVWLVLASAYFYGSWNVNFLALLFASAALDYWLSLRISDTQNQKSRLKYLWVSIVFNLGVLAYFKYYNFFISNLHDLLMGLGMNVNITLLNVILPLGISFYTFQTISYTADVYYEKIQPERSFLNYLLFVFFFPHMVAGPIMRADFLISQIRVKRNLNFGRFLDGLKLFIWGTFKKVVIADNLSKLVDPVFAADAQPTTLTLVIAVYAFSIQIYCDFSGYTDMARGVAGAMGFNLPENFNWPYFSKSIPEFWRRWHISLSTWLKDYAYLPMAQSFMRKFKGKPVLSTCLALFITFTLCGFWHGAGWNYIIWGAYFGLLLAFCRYIKNTKLEKKLLKIPNGLQLFLIFQMVAVGWFVFRAQSLTQIGTILTEVGCNPLDFTTDIKYQLWVLLFCAGTLFGFEYFQFKKNSQYLVLPKSIVATTAIYVFLLYAIFMLGLPDHVPFVYFQF